MVKIFNLHDAWHGNDERIPKIVGKGNIDSWGQLETLEDEIQNLNLAVMTMNTEHHSDLSTSVKTQIERCESIIESANKGILVANEMIRIARLIQTNHSDKVLIQTLEEKILDIEDDLNDFKITLGIQKTSLEGFKETELEMGGAQSAIQSQIDAALLKNNDDSSNN